MKSSKIYEENTYTGFSISKLVYWKYSRLRTFVHRERNSDRHEALSRLKKTRELKNTKSGPALITLRGKNVTSLDLDIIQYFSERQAIFAVNEIPKFTNSPNTTANYIVLNDEPFWFSSEARFESIRKRLLVMQGEKLKVIQPAQRANLVDPENTIHYHGNPLTTIIRNHTIDKVMGIPNVTSFYAIASAIYLGFSPIILSGFELSFAKYLTADDSGFWINQNHYSDIPTNRIRLDSFRRSVPDLFGSLAFQIQSLKMFDVPILILGYESLVDSVPKISSDSLRQMFFEG